MEKMFMWLARWLSAYDPDRWEASFRFQIRLHVRHLRAGHQRRK